MKNLSKYFAVAGVATIVLSGCAGGAIDKFGAEGAIKGADSKACAVSDAGGWDDKSFNEPAYEGLEAAKNSLGMKINTAESLSDVSFVPSVEAMVDDGRDLIIGVGFKIGKALHQPVEANTDIKYALVDSSLSGVDFNTVVVENGRPLLFNTVGAVFLAGYVVAGITKIGKVATSDGIQIPPISIFMGGFADGVAAYNKIKGTDAQLLDWDKATQNGSSTQPFDDQALGKQQAQQFIGQGADITMPVAGPIGLGAAAAAKESGFTLITGVDSDQYDANPDYSLIIPTSVTKQIGASAEQTIKDSVEGRFSPEPYIGSLVNGGASLALFHDFGAQVPQEFRDEVEKLSEQIKSGEFKIEPRNSPK